MRSPSTNVAREVGAARASARFGWMFAAIAACLFVVYVFPVELFGVHGDWLGGYLEAYARLAGGVLSIFDAQVRVRGTQIVGRYHLEIIRNCDAAEVTILFASAVLAFPAPAGRRLMALSIGSSSVVTANVLRICCLYYVGVYSPRWFRVMHEEIWPLILVVFVAASFLGWARYMTAGRPSHAPA